MKLFQRTVCLMTLILSWSYCSAEPPWGEVWAWGENSAGVVTGTPHVGYTTGVVTVAGEKLTDITAVAAGYFHAVALRRDGTPVGWGSNQEGQALGSEPPRGTNGLVTIGGRTLSNVVQVAAGNFSLALRRDRRVVTWGRNDVPSGFSNVVAIAARGFYTLALKGDGTVVSWGSQPWCETHVPEGLSNVTAIAAGGEDYERSMALKSDGTVVVWKSAVPSREPVPPDVTNVVAIAAGKAHSLALKRDGTVIGWGFNRHGQATGIPTEREPYISRGQAIVDGKTLTDAIAIAAAGEYSMALTKDGRVVAWGNKRFYKDVPAGLTNVVAIVAGESFALAIKRP
jgi:alpha-tubulin suppressor-like RCC1 family protein